MINNILDCVDADEHKIFITGKGNFREEVATIAPYKGNRDEAHKPIHYKAIGEYLVNHWGADVVPDMEADDAMGIMQWKHLPFEEPEDRYNTVICTLDKDLNMIPGLHYNWKNEEFSFITEQEANVFFYRQLLTGDATDNIIGCGKREETVYKSGKKKGQKYMKRKGIGPKKAEQLIPSHATEEEMYKTVKKEYEALFKDEWEEKLRENADLLWIRREEDTGWVPPEDE